MGGLFDRPGCAQRFDRLWQGGGAWEKPPGRDSRYFSRQRQNLLRRVRSKQGAALRVTLVLPGNLRRAQEHDGPNDEGPGIERRRGSAQLSYRLLEPGISQRGKGQPRNRQGYCRRSAETM